MIQVTPHAVIRAYVRQRSESKQPLFIKIKLRLLITNECIDLFFLLDWWGQRQTYIARQVVPVTEVQAVGYRFVRPNYRLRELLFIRRRLRLTYGVKHIDSHMPRLTMDQVLTRIGGVVRVV